MNVGSRTSEKIESVLLFDMLSQIPEDSLRRLAEVEKLRWKKFHVLSSGFVCLVDCMGSDDSVVQAARVSYGAGTKQVSEDQGLINYLMRHRHSTPFEMAEIKLLVRVPMDCWRQWIRHRTACLAGDTPLVFSRPCDGRAYRLTAKEVFDRFQPTQNTQRPDKQRNPYFKRDRIQQMQLRCMNERTGEVLHTSIVDIWQSGVKQLFKVTIDTAHGLREIRASQDHLFLTPLGWKKLVDLAGEVITISSREGVPASVFNKIDPDSEEWGSIVGWEDYYEISTQGRVRRIVGGRGSRSHGRCKQITVSNGRGVTSLNRPGEQVVIQVHHEMLRTFVGEPEAGQECLHSNGNSLDNRIDNLRWGSSGENAQDMVDHGRSMCLCSQVCRVVSIVPDGEEMTYDVEVAGPWHNFSANDFVVHNSVNEYSTRYSEAIDEMDQTAPNAWRLQSGSNKQGSDGTVEEWPVGVVLQPYNDRVEVMENLPYTMNVQLDSDSTTPGEYLSQVEKRLHEISRAAYETRLKFGVAREQARKDLPLSTYCYDSATEVLTSSGFIPWPEVKDHHQLGVWNPETGSLQYETPEYLTRDRYDGMMYRVHHRGVDLLVTPHHKMYVQTQFDKGFHLVAAEELGHRSLVRYQKCAPFLSPKSAFWLSSFSPYADRDPAAFCEFAGFFLGDGNAPKTGDKNALVFHLRKPRKIEYLKRLCVAMGLTCELRAGQHVVRGEGITEFFRDRFYAGEHKTLPYDLRAINQSDAQAILRGLRNSDGTTYGKRGSWKFPTTSPFLAEQIVQLGIHAGEAVNGPKLVVAAKDNCQDLYRVGFLDRGREPVVNQMTRNTAWEPYSGFVYCAKTSTGILVVRRNGRVVLSGNTMAYWKIDLHNLLHFLGLRMDSHAQQEIRQYATTIGLEIVKPLFPKVWSAFEAYRLNSSFVSESVSRIIKSLKKYAGDPDYFSGGDYNEAAFRVAVRDVFPDWVSEKKDGALKPHRERDEARATLQALGLLKSD